MSKFTNPKCQLILLALVIFMFQGNVYAQDYDFEEVAEQGGLVVMEAENYSELIIQDGVTNWELVTTPDLFSGTGAMQATPIDGSPYADATNALANSPILSYKINFLSTGNFFIQVRELHSGGGDDSFHAGLDNEIPASSEKIARGTSIVDQWYWVDTAMNGEKPYVAVVAGVHEFKIYIRECGLKIDKIVLTRNPDYLAETVENGFGPAETLRPSNIESLVSNRFGLYPAYPNPFGTSTTLSYNLVNSGHVSLNVFDLTGHKIATLVDDFQNTGRHEYIFNADNVNKGRLADGIYLIELKSGTQYSRIKLQLLR